jgi:hypothetical protein
MQGKSFVRKVNKENTAFVMPYAPVRIWRSDRDVGENLIAVTSACLSSSKDGLKKQRTRFLPKVVILTQKILNRPLGRQMSFSPAMKAGLKDTIKLIFSSPGSIHNF